MSNERASAFDCGGGSRTRGARSASLARIAGLVRVALPQHCELCAARTGGTMLWVACDSALPRVASPCPVCGLPSLDRAICGACVASPPAFAATVAALIYAFPVDRLLQRIRCGGSIALAAWAGASLAAAVLGAGVDRRAARRPDCVVALPLAAARQRERGFNQAALIAGEVAESCSLRLAAPLARVTGGLPQTALPWKERGRNVRGAFAVRSDVGGARIALVDNVMTTGATLAEASLVLIAAGAAAVECWVVARTLRPQAGEA